MLEKFKETLDVAEKIIPQYFRGASRVYEELLDGEYEKVPTEHFTISETHNLKNWIEIYENNTSQIYLEITILDVFFPFPLLYLDKQRNPSNHKNRQLDSKAKSILESYLKLEYAFYNFVKTRLLDQYQAL